MHKLSLARTVAAICAAATPVMLVGWAPHAQSAVASPVPYTDSAVTGSVGLCDAAGRPVTHGNINDKPFVWRAVSSTPAGRPYDERGRKATLLAYQPRTGASPDQWSGDTLTSSSTYTNPKYPMTQATALDFSLRDFLAEFRPMWDGLIELRIYLSAPQLGTLNSSYPATDIRITGDTWTVVRGPSVTCTDGSAAASEIVPAGGKGSSTPPHDQTSAATGSGTPSRARPAGTSTRVSATRAPAAPSTRARASDTPNAAGEGGSGGGSAFSVPAALAGLGAVMLVLAGGAYWWRRRRSG